MDSKIEDKLAYKSTDTNQEYSDLVSGQKLNELFNKEKQGNQENKTLRVLSLFSGCGGMDLGLEGGFICHRKSVTDSDYIHQAVNDEWVLLKRNIFRTVFACDILEEAKLTWLKYMSRFDVNPNIYHLESIVDLVKQHNEGRDVFPHDIDIVTGGFPCQDFSVAGKRKGFDSSVSHNGGKRGRQAIGRDQRQVIYVDETGH